MSGERPSIEIDNDFEFSDGIKRPFATDFGQELPNSNSESPMPILTDEEYDRMTDERDENESFGTLQNNIEKDAHQLLSPENISILKKLSFRQRFKLLAIAASVIYFGADDFDKYFSQFPEDAPLVSYIVTNPHETDFPDYQKFVIAKKAFESAAKATSVENREGYLEGLKQFSENRFDRFLLYRISNLFISSEKSRLAKKHLIDSVDPQTGVEKYKLSISEIFGRYGEDVVQGLKEFIHLAEELRNSFKQGRLNIEDFLNIALSKINNEDKVSFLKDIIELCHRSIIYHEVMNDDRTENDYSRYSNTELYGIMYHSVIFDTDHLPDSYTKDEYLVFEPSFDGNDSFTYERIIQVALKTTSGFEDELEDQDLDYFFDFWNKNGNPAYSPEIAAIGSAINPSLFANKILERILVASKSEKKRLLSTLFRVELGKVGISKEGLDYLGRKFDLGSANRPDYFAHRLTPSGKVGIFNEDRVLEGYVQLESTDFTDEQGDTIKKAVINITIEMLFAPRPDETQEERENREVVLEEFKTNFFSVYLEVFDKESSLHFNNLELAEQGFVLQFLKDASEKEKTHFFEFCNHYGEDGLRFFRVIEFADEIESADIVEHVSKIDAFPLILSEVSEIYSIAPQTARAVAKRLEVDESSYEIQKITENIYRLTSNIAQAIIKLSRGENEAEFVGLGGEIRSIKLDETNFHLPDSVPLRIKSIFHQGVTELLLLKHTIADLLSEEDSLANPSINDLLFRPTIEKRDIDSVDLQSELHDPDQREHLTRAGFQIGKEPLSADTAQKIRIYIAQRKKSPLFLDAPEISSRLRSLYEKPIEEFNLRDYEGKTTNTELSLSGVWDSIERFERYAQSTTNNPNFQVKTILDIAGGDGRSGIPLTYLGPDTTVNAYDISPQMVSRSEKRVREDRENHELYEIAKKAQLPVSDDPNQAGRYNEVVGDFFTFNKKAYERAFPESDRPQAITLMWHSFCFAGSQEGQLRVLKNAYDILDENGIMIIEIPDRSFGSYREAIANYHLEHPEEPFGVLVDAPSKKTGVASEQDTKTLTPRYFPSLSEIKDLAKRAGFTQVDTKSHIVTHKTEDGREVPVIRELMFTLGKINSDILEEVVEFTDEDY